MWRKRNHSLFAIGSQGVEYALVAHWRAEGWLQSVLAQNSGSEQSQIVAVSGSVSPVTASQNDWAQGDGFDLISFAAEASLDKLRWQAEIDAAVERARAVLSSGRFPLVVTARGPNDEAVARFRAKLAASGCDPPRHQCAYRRGLKRDSQAPRWRRPSDTRCGLWRRHPRLRLQGLAPTRSKRSRRLPPVLRFAASSRPIQRWMGSRLRSTGANGRS
jgi:hypothetical protein